jgi:hypothetical protein
MLRHVLVASSLCVLSWSVSGFSQLELPNAPSERLEYPKLLLELPHWSLDRALSRQPSALELSIDKVGASDFSAALLTTLEPDDAERHRSRVVLGAQPPPRLAPFGAYTLQMRPSRTDVCLDVERPCDRAWRHVMRLEWMTIRRGPGSGFSQEPFLQVLRGEF